MSNYEDNSSGRQNKNGQTNTAIDSLTTKVNELPDEITPERDLWPGIEKAIGNMPQQREFDQGSRHWQTWSKVAASFAPVALVLGLWLSPEFNAGSENDASQLFNPIAASFDIQKRQLLIQVSDQTSVVENWQDSLKELEQAEKALITALQSQPEDPALMKMLYQVYQQQLELIQKAHKPELANKFSQI